MRFVFYQMIFSKKLRFKKSRIFIEIFIKVFTFIRRINLYTSTNCLCRSGSLHKTYAQSFFVFFRISLRIVVFIENNKA